MSSFISLYFSDPSCSNLFFLRSLLLLHWSRISAVTQVFSFFLLMIIAKDLTGCFSYCCVEDMIIESMSASSLFMMVRGANFPPTIAWKVSNTLGSFGFSRPHLGLVCFGLLIFVKQRWKVIISKSWSLQMSAPGNFVFWQCSLLIRSISSLACNQSAYGLRMRDKWDSWCCSTEEIPPGRTKLSDTWIN